MKAILIKLLLPVILDALFSALNTMVRKSSNPIDDKIVAALESSRDELLDEIKRAV